MSYAVTLGTFTKRVNSTRRPDTSGWRAFSFTVKDQTDLDRPTITLRMDGDFPKINYGYIEHMAAYYWVTDVVAVRSGVYDVSLQMDLLATYKDNILATSALIEYGFNTDSSGAQHRLQDTRQNVSMVPVASTHDFGVADDVLTTGAGCYVLTAVGAQGGVAAYCLTVDAMHSLLEQVSSDIYDAIASQSTLEEIFSYFSQNMVSQGSAISAIRNCIWLPVLYSAVAALGSSAEIMLGDFATGVNGIKIGSNSIIKRMQTIGIPWPAADWKRYNSQILVYLPYVGTVSVPVQQCNGASDLTITFCLDVLSGDISVRLDAGVYTCYIGSANCAAPYAVGSSNVPTTNVIGGMIGVTQGAIQLGGGIAGVAMGDVSGGLQSVAGSLGTVFQGALQTLTPVVQCAGTLSGSAASGQNVRGRIELLYYPPLDDTAFQALYGYPVFRIATPVAGYCKTRGFSVAIPGRMAEAMAINAWLDSGVFIE